MKRTNIILLLVVLILGGGAYWFLNNKQDTSLSGYDFDFAVKDTASVYKIFLADRNGKQVTLTRESKTEWKVNNKYKARADVMGNLLETINKVELMYRLPRNAVQNVVKDIASSGIKVEIYDKGNKKLKSYYVGGSNMDESGTHMMMEDANEPYVTHIPGINATLRVRYFTDEIDWRDRMIFTLSPEQIKSVSIEYPLQKIKSFKLTNDSRNAQVEPLFPLTPRINMPPVKGLVESFLTGFKFLGAEGFENGFNKMDSLRATVPFAIIKVQKYLSADRQAEGVVKSLKLHPIVPRNADGSLIIQNEGNVVVERYYVETETDDLYLIQHVVFQKIFWAYEGFFSLKKI